MVIKTQMRLTSSSVVTVKSDVKYTTLKSRPKLFSKS